MKKTQCFHCGDEVPEHFKASVAIQGVDRPMCCIGCQSIAQMIVDNGMTAFYERRKGLSQKPSSVVPDELQLYDDASVQAALVKPQESSTASQSDSKQVTLVIGGVHCAACTWLIERTLQREQGIKGVTVNSVTQIMHLQWDDRQIKLSQIMTRLHQLGYEPSPYSPDTHSEQMDKDYRYLLKRVGVAGLGMMQVMMFSIGLYVGAFDDIAQSHQLLLESVSFLITTIVLFYSAGFILGGAIRSILKGQVRLDVPIALALLLAYFGSIASMLWQGEHVFYDSVTMFVFFLLVGRFWELSIRHKSARVLLKQNTLKQLFVQTLSANGQTKRIPLVNLNSGQQLLIEAGEIIPVDATLLSDSAELNLAVVSGEAEPVTVNHQQAIAAGAVNLACPIIVRANTTWQENSYLQLLQASEVDRSQRAPFAEISDQVAPGFVVIVLSVAIISALLWLPSGIEMSLWTAVTVLAVSCPCALSLAAPVAFSFAQLALAKSGMTIRDRRFIELLPNITDVVFDKTGTLTEVAPGIEGIVNHSDLTDTQILAIAAALQQSRHPIAIALEQYRDDDIWVSDQKTAVGGVSGIIDSQLYHFGSARYLAENGIQIKAEGQQSVLCRAGTVLAEISFKEQLRKGSLELCQELKVRGLHLHVLSGDLTSRVEKVVKRLGIESYQSACAPLEKGEYIQRLQQEGKKVLMIGDGTNDLRGLACADLSLALADGNGVTVNRSDAVIDGTSLKQVSHFLSFSRRVRYTIQQNGLWAIGYNVIAISLAALGWLTPYWAALGMSLSSIAVLVNASRLAKAIDIGTEIQEEPKSDSLAFDSKLQERVI